MPSFWITLPTGEQKIINSDKPTLHIGRLPSSEIRIDEATVSRRHAEIYAVEGRYFLRDMGSRNGTYLNGERIYESVPLSSGDRIQVGGATIVFEPPEGFPFLREKSAAQPTSSIDLSTPQVAEVHAPAELLQMIAQIATDIMKARPLESTLDSIVRVCIERTPAERACIMLLADDGRLIPKACLSEKPSQESFAISTTIARKAIEANKAILIKDVAGEDHLKKSQSIADLKIRSAICTPLWNGEKTVGILYVDTTAHHSRFTETELFFFSALSGMVAEKIENALLAEIAAEKQRLDTELEVAKQIQHNLLPKQIPEIEGYEISCFNRPSTEVGGDYYDVIDLSKLLALSIGDVAGKGIGAAMLMANVQAIVRARTELEVSPGELLSKINTDLAGRVGEGRFVSFFFLVLEPQSGKIAYSNAGHNPPIIVRKDGTLTELAVNGIPLGIMEHIDYETSREMLAPGDLIALYSDGITECMDKSGGLFGDERFKKVLTELASQPAHAVRDAIIKATDEFRKDTPPSDDMTLVVLRRK